jgi:hypothetical protein
MGWRDFISRGQSLWKDKVDCWALQVSLASRLETTGAPKVQRRKLVSRARKLQHAAAERVAGPVQLSQVPLAARMRIGRHPLHNAADDELPLSQRPLASRAAQHQSTPAAARPAKRLRRTGAPHKAEPPSAELGLQSTAPSRVPLLAGPSTRPTRAPPPPAMASPPPRSDEVSISQVLPAVRAAAVSGGGGSDDVVPLAVQRLNTVLPVAGAASTEHPPAGPSGSDGACDWDRDAASGGGGGGSGLGWGSDAGGSCDDWGAASSPWDGAASGKECAEHSREVRFENAVHAVTSRAWLGRGPSLGQG